MPNVEETYDIVVVGAGHAGCEAALACASRSGAAVRYSVMFGPPCHPADFMV